MAAKWLGGGVGGVSASETLFSETVPLDGIKFMPPQMVTGQLTLAAQAESLRRVGGSCYLKLVADGVSRAGDNGGPLFTGMTMLGASSAWANSAGTVNNVQIFWDGTDVYYSITQGANADAQVSFVGSAASSNNLTLSLSAPGIADVALPALSAFTLETTNAGLPVADSLTAVSRQSATALAFTKSRAYTSGDASLISYAAPSANPLLNLTTGKRLFNISRAAVAGADFILTALGAAAATGAAWSLRRLVAGYSGTAVTVQYYNASSVYQRDIAVPFVAGSPNLNLSVDPVLAAGGTGLAGGFLIVARVHNQLPSGSAFDLVSFAGVPKLVWSTAVSKWVIESLSTTTQAFAVTTAATPATLMSNAGVGQIPQFGHYSVMSVGPTATQQQRSFGIGGTTQSQLRMLASISGTAGSSALMANWGTDLAIAGLSAFRSLTVPTNSFQALTSWCDGSAHNTQVDGATVVTDASVTTLSAGINTTFYALGYGGEGGYVGRMCEMIQLASPLTVPNKDILRANQLAYWA